MHDIVSSGFYLRHHRQHRHQQQQQQLVFLKTKLLTYQFVEEDCTMRVFDIFPIPLF